MSKYGMKEQDRHSLKMARSHLQDTFTDIEAQRISDAIAGADATIAELAEALEKWVKYDSTDQQDHVQLMLDYADALKSSKAALEKARVKP
jgi:hypothetical protein